MNTSKNRPAVRFSLLWKITLPFVVLAMILGLGATYVVNQLMAQTDAERFLRQLVDSGQQAADGFVRTEMDLLGVERLVANLEGVPQAAVAFDAEKLRTLVLPLVVNTDVDMVAVLDNEGTSLLVVRRKASGDPGEYDTLRGETFYSTWPFIQKILQGEAEDEVGDKQTGLESLQLNGTITPVFMVAGPLLDEQGQRIGAVVVGNYLPNVVESVSSEAGANLSIYNNQTGTILSTTLEPQNPAQLSLASENITAAYSPDEENNPLREIDVSGSIYWEVLSPLLVRQGTEDFGVLGVSLLRQELIGDSTDDVLMVIRFTSIALVLVILIGLLISNSITKPLISIVDASTQVAVGDLDTKVPEGGADEIGVLSRTFNYMVDGLREGSIYRDLLGRAVTPEVREQLRKTLYDGKVLFKGQSATAAILFADLRGYTTMAEMSNPEDVMDTLNDYFAGVVPIISLHGGVVNKFDGDSVMAFFGILPKSLPPQVSALQAVHAGVEMRDYVDRLNQRRGRQDHPSLEIGIGISTGTVVAGGLGSEDRLHYTVVGDTVNIAQRLQQITRDTGGSGLIVDEKTHQFLGAGRKQFSFGRRGVAQLKGKAKEVTVYEVLGREVRLVDEERLDETINLFSNELPRAGEDSSKTESGEL